MSEKAENKKELEMVTHFLMALMMPESYCTHYK